MFKFFLLILLIGCTSIASQDSIKNGGEWFLNNQNDNFLHYEYDYKNNAYTPDSHALRETAALWSIATLSNYLGDERYEILSQKGFSYFEEHFVEVNDYIYVDIETPSLGYNAFLILALLEMEHHNKDIYLEKLANGILVLQQEYGKINAYFNSDSDANQQYYPGEALVALMSMYEYTGDERYLDATKKGFVYYKQFWREEPNIAMIPWHSRAYYKLYQATNNYEVADFVFEMNNALVKYYDFGNCHFMFRGSELVFVEGMNYALLLANEVNQPTSCYHKFIRKATTKAMKKQIQSDDITNGAFPHSTLRIDHNQHALMALMDAKKYGIIQ